MKHYTIKINDNKKNNNNYSFRNLINNPSKALDDLILSNMKKMNPYLDNKPTTTFITFPEKYGDSTLDAMFKEAGFDTDDRIIISDLNYSFLLKDDFDIEFAKAAKFLANYTPKKKYYILRDKTPIKFFEDEIQIGDDLIPLYKLTNPADYIMFSPATKNTIINIYISIR